MMHADCGEEGGARIEESNLRTNLLNPSKERLANSKDCAYSRSAREPKYD